MSKENSSSFKKNVCGHDNANVNRLSLLSYIQGTNTDKTRFIDQLFSGLKELGFIILKDHNIADEKVKSAYEEVESFFELPVDIKEKYFIKNGLGQRGYTPFGKEHAVNSSSMDLKEFWHVGREVSNEHPYSKYYHKNLWPSEIEHFKTKLLELYNNLDTCSYHLIEALNTALDLPENYLYELIKDGNSVLRLIHYPAMEKCPKRDKLSLRAAAHGDINLITILVGATNSGLQLLDRNKKWLNVVNNPGELVVDSGDMLARITNEVIPATIHRVINPDEDSTRRFSMPFFVHPHPDAVLECVPSCVGDFNKYPPIKAHDFLLKRLEDIGLQQNSSN